MGITTLPLDAILQSTEHDLFPLRRALSDVSLAVTRSRRAVVISGAGISCSSGIPDFRSNDGLYNLVKERYPDAFFTGKDLFSSGLFNSPETTSLFYTFIGELAASCVKAQPTRTHHFINRLHTKGKLLRSYTQNIDGLERRIGLESGGRGSGFKKTTTKNVEMHGDLGRVRCVLCMADFEAKLEWMEMFRMGCAPWCPSCETRNAGRIRRSARELAVGSLRPAIVLYDEPHPYGEAIGDLQAYDLLKKPDLLLVMGTSLKVHGLKLVVREFAKAVHAKNGLVVFINLTPPSKEWEEFIDIHIAGETDVWVKKVEEDWRHFRPGDWELQTKLEGEVIKEMPRVKPAPKAKGTITVKAVPKAKAVSTIAAQGTKAKRPAANKSKKTKAAPQGPPTPRSSQSPSRILVSQDSSSFVMFGSDDELTPPPPSPRMPLARLPTPGPSSPLSSPPASPRLAPLSPSKRRANVPPSPVSVHDRSPPKKRTIYPAFDINTGVRASPGSGNLFPLKTMLDGDWEDVITAQVDDEVFGSPVKAKTRRGRLSKSIDSVDDKENVKPKTSKVAAPRSKPTLATTGARPKRATTLRRAEVTT